MSDKPETPSGPVPLVPEMPEYQRLIGSDPLLRDMAKSGVPLNRENYIAANWPDGFGDEGWGWEHEEQLPRPFQADYEPDDD